MLRRTRTGNSTSVQILGKYLWGYGMNYGLVGDSNRGIRGLQPGQVPLGNYWANGNHHKR